MTKPIDHDSLTQGERDSLGAARQGAVPIPGELSLASPYEERRDSVRGGQEENAGERRLRGLDDETRPFEANSANAEGVTPS
ncbi:MAG: hypothetical protein ACR2HB_05590 [Dehalococcoidia bacterium]